MGGRAVARCACPYLEIFWDGGVDVIVAPGEDQEGCFSTGRFRCPVDTVMGHGSDDYIMNI